MGFILRPLYQKIIKDFKAIWVGHRASVAGMGLAIALTAKPKIAHRPDGPATSGAASARVHTGSMQ